MYRLRIVVCALALAAGGVTACGSDDKTGGATETDAAKDVKLEVVTFDVNPINPDAADANVPPSDTPTADATTQVDTGPDIVPPKPGEFGYECDENDDCNSGWCIQTAEGRKCTKTCQDECPAFFDCREAPGTDATFICLPRFMNLCDPCDETLACNGAGQAGNFCLGYGEVGSFCGGECRGDGDCPTSFVCREVPVGGGGTAKQCVPAGGQSCGCSPLAKALQLSTTCYVDSEHGRCEGTRFCTQAGLNICDAAQPFPESCNGKDDNCNGQTDEFAPDYVCLIENEFGSCPGAGTCADGVETCNGTAPAPESCDGQDNDCDGETDEDLCDDLNPCTEDFCNADEQCEHAPLTSVPCDDGTVCTADDICQNGVCQGFNPLSCGDGDICKDWFCDPVAGCLSQFNDADCEDGSPCTDGDTCNQGVCVSGGATDCNDANPCTIDQCTPGVGCTYTNAPNNSGCGGEFGACSSGTCQNGACLGTPVNEGNACPLGGVKQCQRSVCRNGGCSIEDKPQGLGCTTNKSQCPDGTCNGSGTCVPRTSPPQTCSEEVGFLFCTEDVPGVCTSSGNCEPTSGSCQCTGSCSSFCICCVGLQLCLDFLFGF